jgi:DNA-binding SARP family transcriptional activator
MILFNEQDSKPITGRKLWRKRGKQAMQVEQVRQNDLDIPSSCRLRVFLHGPLEVWKREDSGVWKLVDKDAWGKGRPARSVFKRLLVANARRLSRGSLQDDLWPDTENFELADKNVYNAINQIRRVIGKNLVRTVETIYEVADQSLIWVDRDACEALLKEAEDRGYTSIQVLPLLEQALEYLGRGELLEGESGTWVYRLRKKSEDMLRQCRLWLAESYEIQGKLWQAGEQYRALCTTLPPDEDALQRWLEMLYRQGKRQDALKCFQEMRNFMEVQGFPPSNTLEQVVASLENREDLNRREATKRISTLASSLLLTVHQPFSLIRAGELLHSEEVLSICTTNIPILWRLYFDGHLAEVRQLLFPHHLPQLLLLVQRPNYRKSAAGLASKASQLAALIEKHHRNLGNALRYAQQGEHYGLLAENPDLQIAALIQQGNIYFDLGQSWRELQTYQKAYHIAQEAKRNSEISPLLLGRVYIGLAKSYGKFSDHQPQALRFLDLAHETYPEHPETDLAFNYSYHTQFTLLNHTGLAYLNMGQPEQALSIFEQVFVPPALVPRRLELLIRRSMTSFALGDLEQMCEHVSLAATSARMLGSDLRYNESYNLYELMVGRWPQEARVKTLAEHFH